MTSLIFDQRTQFILIYGGSYFHSITLRKISVVEVLSPVVSVLEILDRLLLGFLAESKGKGWLFTRPQDILEVDDERGPRPDGTLKVVLRLPVPTYILKEDEVVQVVRSARACHPLEETRSFAGSKLQ